MIYSLKLFHVNRELMCLPSHPLYDVMFMNIIKCGYYSRAALIPLSMLYVQLVFEDGYYSNKYGMPHSHINLFQIHTLNLIICCFQPKEQASE